MHDQDFSQKTCAVIGLARAGVPAARFLAARGAHVIGYDDKPFGSLSAEAQALRDEDVELRLGDLGFAGLERCDMVVLSPGLKVHHEPLRSVIAEYEARGTEVIGELELAARHCPAPIIAVTGTKGKSTTVKLIAEILAACGQDAVRAGNTGTPLIAELPSLSPQSWAVVEVSSFQLERAPTFKPRVGVLLNLLADHQDYHPTTRQYWETKLKLFANQNADDVATFNLDDARVAELWHGRGAFSHWRNNLRASVVGSSARNEIENTKPVYVRRHDGMLGFEGTAFVPVIAVDEVPLHGDHNGANVAAALAACGMALGIGSKKDGLEYSEAMAAAIRNFQSLPHRLEIVAQKEGITWVNDSQATIPDATIRALEAFPAPVTLIAGGRAKLGSEAYAPLGAAIARHAYAVLTIGEAADTIAQVAQRAGCKNKVVAAGTLTTAVEKAKTLTPRGGTVVFSPACASFDQFSSFEERGAAFRAEVAKLSS